MLNFFGNYIQLIRVVCILEGSTSALTKAETLTFLANWFGTAVNLIVPIIITVLLATPINLTSNF